MSNLCLLNNVHANLLLYIYAGECFYPCVWNVRTKRRNFCFKLTIQNYLEIFDVRNKWQKHEGTECSRWLLFDRSFRSRGFANRIDRKAVRLEYGSKKSTKSWNSPITSPLIERHQTWQIHVFNQAKNRFREQSLFLRFKEVQVTLYVMNISHTWTRSIIVTKIDTMWQWLISILRATYTRYTLNN